MNQKGTQCCLKDDADLKKEEVFVSMTLRRIPGGLLQEFARRVSVNYSGGMSEAIQDLMKKALKE